MPTPADRLAEARGSGEAAVLRGLVGTGYPFVDEALAENPDTPVDVLVALAGARWGGWNRNRVLFLLAGHPAADGVVLAAVGEAVAEALGAGERPYAAVLVLAARPGFPVERARALGELAGASARLRGGLARVLAGRGRPAAGAGELTGAAARSRVPGDRTGGVS
ncbi:hypothetical protein ACIQBJ_28070 [Kitasatospora sp. NPDC088391]|uniref:hypothetical protein n=1 Tax=Kitasatospora sp. NPDC088391 TaxID=3364074 RepID=UPI00381C6119